ncbi:AcrR family transcriptional regulator [Saccharothrix coeruleofusca]|uniref:TetR/AcrR family transcriptional regulator n=1 Tax=Saccharothrix coeruleofusca TaxID=33919 RepID=UPI0027DBBCB4|nr:helix-turn-helix domain-containing protein [Saccharothrix coeruleofusca]MBP2339443.1 AcrR family transcriptional regulator [Saccharothrix coeruleofusca]
MGRPRRSDARDNRERILAVARLAVATDGPDVPIREIARRARIGVATVYRHFPDKDALLAEAFAAQPVLCSAVVEEGLAQPDAWLGFRLVLEELVRAHASGRDFIRALVPRLPPEAGFAADHARTLRMLAELVRRARRTGELRADFVLEDLILALMANRGMRAGSPDDRQAAARRLAALMIQSFRAGPERAPLPPAVRLPLRPAGPERTRREHPLDLF